MTYNENSISKLKQFVIFMNYVKQSKDAFDIYLPYKDRFKSKRLKRLFTDID